MADLETYTMFVTVHQRNKNQYNLTGRVPGISDVVVRPHLAGLGADRQWSQLRPNLKKCGMRCLCGKSLSRCRDHHGHRPTLTWSCPISVEDASRALALRRAGGMNESFGVDREFRSEPRPSSSLPHHKPEQQQQENITPKGTRQAV